MNLTLDTGRKFWITVLGVVAASLRPEAAASVAAMVMAFNGANAVISWAYAGKEPQRNEAHAHAD